MMVLMWKTEHGAARIERVECTRVTGASVWFMKRRFKIGGSFDSMDLQETKAARRGDCVNYHATWDDAHAYLLDDAQFVVQSKRRQLELANAHYGNVKGLRKPACVAVG